MAKIYECKQPIELSRKDFERLNKLFKVDFDSEAPEMESLINELDARRNTNPATFWWKFEDDSTIVMDIHSSECGYYGEIFIVGKDNGNGHLIEGYADVIEKTAIFPVGESEYVCKIKIIERCPNCGKAFSLEECDEDPIPMNDLEGNSYTIYYCPDCGAKIYEEKIIEEDK